MLYSVFVIQMSYVLVRSALVAELLDHGTLTNVDAQDLVRWWIKA